MKKQSRSRRRRPGEPWQLWEVAGIDSDSGKSRRMGYLVTTGDRLPMPIAYIHGTGSGHLALTASIRANPRLAAKAVDLRKVPLDKLPGYIVGMELWPIDTIGRQITTDRTFEGGMYMKRRDGSVEGFMLFTHGSMPRVQKMLWETVQLLHAVLSSRRQQKSGSPLPHNTPQLGGKKGVGAVSMAAA
jgi:hypothetical protein